MIERKRYLQNPLELGKYIRSLTEDKNRNYYVFLDDILNMISSSVGSLTNARKIANTGIQQFLLEESVMDF